MCQSISLIYIVFVGLVARVSFHVAVCTSSVKIPGCLPSMSVKVKAMSAKADVTFAIQKRHLYWRN